jgi:ssDNA-binding Zn-finger/Zn-ribbon topoisomerase 1
MPTIAASQKKMSEEEYPFLRSGTEVSIGCPKCGVATKLVVRMNKKKKTKFLGCPNWPECDWTQNVPDHIWMEASGQSSLFDE